MRFEVTGSFHKGSPDFRLSDLRADSVEAAIEETKRLLGCKVLITDVRRQAEAW